MKINLTLLEKLLGVVLFIVQQIQKIVDENDEQEKDKRAADVAIADAVRTKFPNVMDSQLLEEIAKANEVNEIIDCV